MTRDSIWSPKQHLLIDALEYEPVGKYHVVASGPKRAGKSYPGNCFWLQRAGEWRNADFGLCTYSAARQTAILYELEGWCRKWSWPYRKSIQYWEFGRGNKLWFWCGNNSTSHYAIEGFTLRGGLVDEAIRVDPKSVNEMSIRCTPVGGDPVWPATIFYSTNPDGPSHPFKTGFMDGIERGDRPGRVLYFGVDDNPAIAESEKQEMKMSFPEGVQRDRGYYGKWAEAGGAMFPGVARWTVAPPKADTEVPYRCDIAVDTAEVGIWHALLIGRYSRDRAWVLQEWRHDGRTAGPIPKPDALRQVLRLGQTAPAKIGLWIVDSADQGFGHMLEQEIRDRGLDGKAHYQWGKPGIPESTRWVNATAASKRLFLSLQVPKLREELEALRWDDNKMEASGTESPATGQSDHGADALRYWVAETDAWKPTYV